MTSPQATPRGRIRAAALSLACLATLGLAGPLGYAPAWSAPNGPPAYGPLGNRLPELDPNAPAFPDSSLVDFGYLLEGPTDRHGFLFLGT
ncbi:MAG TPA: hypothetical protein VM283_01590, partial [Armatimonadota bacterium]|nr:hypothetical protein [Armatimonadota bacterium]